MLPSAVAASTRRLLRPAAGPALCWRAQPARRAVPTTSPWRRLFSAGATPITSPVAPFAFAFDIDGVLLHVNDPIPGAAAALRFLHAHGIPFILLTNGGGRYEADRVADLQRRLGLDAHDDGAPLLSTANFVQSHTPFQELIADIRGLDGVSKDGPAAASDAAAGLRDQTVLVTGSDAARARTIAERYGFRSVVTPADILTAYPSIYPFDPLLGSVYANTARPLPRPLLLEGGKRPASSADLDDSRYLRIAAAFVFNDPRDWAVDIQLLTDLLQSRSGFLGTFDPAAVTHTPNPAPASSASSASSSYAPPRLFFSNGDLLWATTYHLPRLGQGAFAAAVAGVWAQLAHGQDLAPHRATLLGKPNPATYRYAERVLMRYRETLLARHHAKTAPAAVAKPLQTVYMVGDNPASDIAGANQFHSAHGTDWCSVLVGTGVYNPARDGTTAEHLPHRPRAIVDDVGAAVRWALQREGWAADF